MRFYLIQVVMKDGTFGYWSEDERYPVPFNSERKSKYTKEEGLDKAIKLSKEFKTIFVLTNLKEKEIKYIREEIEKEVLKGY